MIAIRLDVDIEEALEMLAKLLNKNKNVIVREALLRYFEDIEDSQLAEDALREMKGRKSLSELRRELGFDS